MLGLMAVFAPSPLGGGARGAPVGQVRSRPVPQHPPPCFLRPGCCEGLQGV